MRRDGRWARVVHGPRHASSSAMWIESTRACYERAEQFVIPRYRGEILAGMTGSMGPVQRLSMGCIDGKTVRSVADGSDLDLS